MAWTRVLLQAIAKCSDMAISEITSMAQVEHELRRFRSAAVAGCKRRKSFFRRQYVDCCTFSGTRYGYARIAVKIIFESRMSVAAPVTALGGYTASS